MIPISRVKCYDIDENSSVFLSEIKELPTLIIGDLQLRLEIEEPPPDMKETARKELRETTEIAEAAKQELKNILKEDKELNVPWDNDAWLVRFLRPTKFYPESAHKLIKNYYQFKVKHKDIYEGLVPTKEKNVFEQNILLVLPNRDQLGRRVLILELGKKWKPKKCSLDEIFKGIVMFLELAMYEPITQICGAVVIFDMEDLSLSQAWKFTPQFAKRIVDWLQDSVPLRVKALHVVNQPKAFELVFALFKPFLKDKLRSRIFFHGKNRDSLYEHISPKCIPESLFDSILEVTSSEWFDLLKYCDEEYEKINSYGVVTAEKKTKSKK